MGGKGGRGCEAVPTELLVAPRRRGPRNAIVNGTVAPEGTCPANVTLPDALLLEGVSLGRAGSRPRSAPPRSSELPSPLHKLNQALGESFEEIVVKTTDVQALTDVAARAIGHATTNPITEAR